MNSQVSKPKSLEEILETAGNPVELLRNSQIGPYAFPVVRHEFTNWRDEQRSWRETCALFDQSHHMTDVYVEGSDAVKVFSDLGINSFKNFKINQAKQFVACNHAGYVIGEDRKSTRLNSSHGYISYAVFCLKKKKKNSMKTIALQ